MPSWERLDGTITESYTVRWKEPDGVRFATIWQSLGQMRERYGAASDTILANSTTKLFMGPITDEATRRYLVDLLGHESSTTDRERRTRPKAQAAGTSTV